MLSFYCKQTYRSLLLLVCLLGSCQDLTELNENPNGLNPEGVHPRLLLPTVLTEAARITLELGFGDLAGVMQHTQKDAFFNSHNNYEWGDQNWTRYYAVLLNNQQLYRRAEDLQLALYPQMALIMRSYMYGLISDLWGDAPYHFYLQEGQDSGQSLQPAFTPQQEIYQGILAELREANLQLMQIGSQAALPEDVLFGGDVLLWRKFANALRLRYLMRIAEKEPETARREMEAMLADAERYPLPTEHTDDAAMSYIGNSVEDSWPANTVFDGSGGSAFRRTKPCSTLLEAMQALDDPRLGVWFSQVEIPIVVDSSLPANTDQVVEGVRYLSSDRVGAATIDTDPLYVGLPPSVSSLPSEYNLNPTPGQLSYNPHVSYLHARYQEAAGPLLKARLLSATEVHFVLAEAAFRGWQTVADAATHYQNGVRTSLESWEVPEAYQAYIGGAAAYQGSLAQIMEQKWIASWTAAAEAWFDYRRTGLPALQAGPVASRPVLPLRFSYMQEEMRINQENVSEALQRLEATPYSQADGPNSAWARPWLLQHTSKPW